MESGSHSTSCMMSFGDNSNGLCPMMMMMPLMTSSNSHHAPDSSSIPLLPPLIPSTSNSILPNRTASFSMVLDNLNHLNSTPNLNSACYYMEDNTTKAKIMAHPLYHRLLAAYINCQKVGAPAEVVMKLEEACASASEAAAMAGTGSSCLGEDPALDQFMEAYCEMLIKYEQELSKPFKEAMLFIQRVERQFNALTISLPNNPAACGGEAYDKNGSSEEEDIDVNNNYIDPQAENHELKGQLLRRYSGYLGNLKQEFMRKKKKGKLPKEARQQLIDWWDHHHKWPYPSEAEKLILAKTTGLDQKQINNWFINQRKRHWKPSEDMQYHLAMDAAHPHYYVDNVLGHPYPMDISSTPY